MYWGFLALVFILSVVTGRWGKRGTSHGITN